MARRGFLGPTRLTSIRIPQDMHDLLQDMAIMESMHTGLQVTVNRLLCMAVEFTYLDNERLRECFRRTREKHQKQRRFTERRKKLKK